MATNRTPVVTAAVAFLLSFHSQQTQGLTLSPFTTKYSRSPEPTRAYHENRVLIQQRKQRLSLQLLYLSIDDEDNDDGTIQGNPEEDDDDGFSNLYNAKQMEFEYCLDLAKEFNQEQKIRNQSSNNAEQQQKKTKPPQSSSKPSFGFFQKRNAKLSIPSVTPKREQQQLYRQTQSQQEPKSNGDNILLVMATSMALQFDQPPPSSSSSAIASSSSSTRSSSNPIIGLAMTTTATLLLMILFLMVLSSALSSTSSSPSSLPNDVVIDNKINEYLWMIPSNSLVGSFPFPQ